MPDLQGERFLEVYVQTPKDETSGILSSILAACLCAVSRGGFLAHLRLLHLSRPVQLLSCPASFHINWNLCHHFPNRLSRALAQDDEGSKYIACGIRCGEKTNQILSSLMDSIKSSTSYLRLKSALRYETASFRDKEREETVRRRNTGIAFSIVGPLCFAFFYWTISQWGIVSGFFFLFQFFYLVFGIMGTPIGILATVYYSKKLKRVMFSEGIT